jgi:hypothetical protein
MAKRILSSTTITPTAVADTVAMTNNLWFGTLFGASATQRTIISEIYLGGQSAATANMIPLFARDSTVPVTLVAGTLFDTPADPATAALAAPLNVGNSAGTPPQRSATGHLLNLSFNPFGGVTKWQAYNDKEGIGIVGTAVSLGSISLSQFTGGTGIAGGHIIYETL